MPQFNTFYQTVAQLCFTLLGLWWLVLQTKYAEWIGNPGRRRMATNISLYFLLPGSMSLLALLASQANALWHIAFVVASAIGVVETAFLLRGGDRPQDRPRIALALRWAGIIFYALVLLVAVLPASTILTTLHLAPLTLAGILLTLLIVLGVSLAWRFFIEPQAT